MASMTEFESFEESSREAGRVLRQEQLILDVTESVIERLSAKGWTQADLARQLGRTRGFVSQLLSGRRNMTLRTLSDLADALGCRAKVRLDTEHRHPGVVVMHPSSERLEWEHAQEREFGPVQVRQDRNVLKEIVAWAR